MACARIRHVGVVKGNSKSEGEISLGTKVCGVNMVWRVLGSDFCLQMVPVPFLATKVFLLISSFECYSKLAPVVMLG